MNASIYSVRIQSLKIPVDRLRMANTQFSIIPNLITLFGSLYAVNILPPPYILILKIIS